MWENQINEVNAILFRFHNNQSPYLPTYNGIVELIALGKDGGESSLILSHLYFALNDLKDNYATHYEQDLWNKMEGFDFGDVEVYNHGELFYHLEALFKDVIKIGSPLTFKMYIDRYGLEPQENLNSNSDDSIPANDNKFNTMPLTDVKNFFNVLIKKRNPKGKIWMNQSDFETFIQRSFGLQTELKKPKINIGRGGKYAFETKTFTDLRSDNFKRSKSKYDWD